MTAYCGKLVFGQGEFGPVRVTPHCAIGPHELIVPLFVVDNYCEATKELYKTWLMTQNRWIYYYGSSRESFAIIHIRQEHLYQCKASVEQLQRWTCLPEVGLVTIIYKYVHSNDLYVTQNMGMFLGKDERQITSVPHSVQVQNFVPIYSLIASDFKEFIRTPIVRVQVLSTGFEHYRSNQGLVLNI